MNYLAVLLVALGAAALFLILRPGRRSAPRARTAPPVARASQQSLRSEAATDPEPVPSKASALQPVVRTVDPHVESMLKDFVLAHGADLPAQDARDIGALLSRIPRPPSALHKLVSPQYLAQANASELSDMVIAEPQIAAKVLVAVNSSLYGLQSPLSSIGHAVTFLGTNTVRSICLQYLLDDSFRSDDPEVKRIFTGLWNASAFASELCFKLAQHLQLPEPGTLVTHVVLSFLGQVASHSLLPRHVAKALVTKGMLERSRIEQDELGLCAAEIGSLLMQQWELPAVIIDRVRAIDSVLLTPCGPPAEDHRTARAFCYLCARLGEKLARGEVKDLGTYQLDQEQGPEFYYLQTYLQLPELASLRDLLHLREVVTPINAMVYAMQQRG
jgi:HD-like signal output (HDOD) protein